MKVLAMAHLYHKADKSNNRAARGPQRTTVAFLAEHQDHLWHAIHTDLAHLLLSFQSLWLGEIFPKGGDQGGDPRVTPVGNRVSLPL